jgi:hypothetical protein
VRKFVITFVITVANIALAIIVVSVPPATVDYAQNTTTTQQTNYSYTNTTNTRPPIKGPNASIIIDAINAKIKSIYGGDDNEKLRNSIPVIMARIVHAHAGK